MEGARKRSLFLWRKLVVRRSRRPDRGVYAPSTIKKEPEYPGIGYR
jgi:hypothetical protein